MKTTYNQEADALYIYVRNRKAEAGPNKTVKLKDRLLVDVDKTGKVVGIELLNASEQMSKADLEKVVQGIQG